MTKTKKGGLGKGLDALFMDNETADSGIVTLRLSEIEPNKDQPRKVFSEESLKIANEHSLDTTLDKYEKIYFDLVNDK